MSESTGSVVIIGGGVIGAACAHYLAERSFNVTVLDSGRFGAACSHGNCGLVCPSHVLPLAEPGAVRRTLAALARPNSPFSIKPRLDFALWSWLFQFARRCNRRDMLDAGRAIQSLLESSLDLYHTLIEQNSLDCEWETQGLLYVYSTAEEMEKYAATDRLLRDEFGLSAERIDGDRLIEFEPALKPGLAGGWYYEHDAHLRPDRLMSSWRQNLIAQGVQIREHCKAISFAKRAAVARAVQTTDGEIAADSFVVATGALAPAWQNELGCRIPIQPGKGYSITMPRPAICPRVPMLLMEHRVGVTPMQSGYRLGSTMEFAGYDDSIHPRRLALLTSGAEQYLREPYTEPIEETWFGWRPMTIDSKPYIDRSPALRNVWLAAGHNMLGLSMAPATGKLIGELVSGDTTHVDRDPFSIRRS